MRGRRLLPFLLFLIPSGIKADSQSFGGQWKGLNNADASIMIGDNEAQDLLNVDITDNGSGIRKRQGYTQFKTIGTSTWGVRGGYYYTDTSGSKYLIHANNRSVFKSLNSGAYSAFITTDTAGTYYDFTDSQGYLYRATSDRDQFCRYDGTTLTYYPSNPLGDQIEAMPDRLVISGVSSYPNRVYFSGAADFTNFTTGLNDTDPFYEQFGLPGQKITAIKYAMGRLFAWTGTTLSYWTGSTQFDGTIQDVTTNIGTTQPGSILYDNSTIFWQGNDKHFYSYDGNSIEKISKTITGSINNIVGGSYKTTIKETQTDFNLGIVSNQLTASESPGFITFPSNGNLVDDFSNGGSCPGWFLSGAQSTSTCTNNYMELNTKSSGGYFGAVISTPVFFSSGNSFSADMKSDNTTNAVYFLGVCRSQPTDVLARTGCYTASIYQPGTNNVYLEKDGSLIGLASTYSLPIKSTYSNFVFSVSTSGYISLSRDGNSLVSTTDTTYSTFSYIMFGVYQNTTDKLYIDNIKIKQSTGTYKTEPLYIGSSISNWGPFLANVTKTTNANIMFTIYTDNDNSIDINNSGTFTSSQTIASGFSPTLSVSPYVTILSSFTRNSSTESVILDNFQLNWYENQTNRVFGAIDKNHRLYWSLAENNSTTNNATYIYDPRFASWLKYSVPMDAITKVGDSFYFGGPSTGVVYLYPSGTNDNGSAITAYWKSKDFIGGDPFLEKDYNSYSIISKTQTGSNISFEYAINGSPTTTSRTISLTNSSGLPFIRNNGRFGNGVIGSFINFKIGNSGADLPFEVYSAKYDYTPRAWRVMQ